MVYHQDVLYTSCGATILLKFIESFIHDKTSEDMVVDKLMDDFVFRIRTVSGAEYTISVKYISRKLGYGGGSVAEITEAIYDKWKFINKP
jgi:hypothetical protein